MNAALVDALRSRHADLSKAQENQMWDYTQALGYVVKTSSACRIAEEISSDTTRRGACRRFHNELATVAGVGRRQVFKAIRKLLDLQFITFEGRSETGAPIYHACWQRGAEYREWAKAYDREFERARKAMKIKSFTPPPYPNPIDGAADVQEAA